ncbi:hypothetical protein [Sphingobacterium sp. IITKGP-BTPF85]|uniref:hypothetical protein n=1 Tax=Sphingobacterium sp. IITKGP-BTPF85 TaxID=1338009 RepID=UPI00041EF297|nr:hypothetical protein [Sphingobacterium sp. IITKGP-BTPF85]
MKRKVIPLFLMLSCCSLYQVKASLLHGISISPVLQEEAMFQGLFLIILLDDQ